MNADSIERPGAIGDATLAEDNDTAAPVLGTTMAGRYQVLGTLGRGGMGVVYLVHDTALDRDLALKLCFDASDTTVVRQGREARALAALDHPNVLEVYDIGDHDGLLYIAMEFVRGGTAKARFGQGQLRPWREVLDFYLGAAAGLTAAHRAGIIHRDFKPENVLVTRDGAAKVADFGLAVRESSGGSIEPPTDLSNSGDRVTRAGAAVGTPAFMAPEQLLGLDLDARADQYSYCATLFEGLFGKRPYLARTVHARLATLALAKIAWPQDTRGVPKHVLRALERGLSADPSQRFDSMPALVEALTSRPHSRWPAAVLSAGVAAALGAAAILHEAPSHCDLGESIGWNSEARSEVERRLDGLEPLASRRIVQNLDRLASSWNAERDRYCGEMGAPMGSPATSTCLARIRDGFHARVDLLRSGQPDVVRQGYTLVANLTPSDSCRNPTDGGLNPEQQEVLALIEASTAHFHLGRVLEADALATRASSLALRAAQPSLLARALVLRSEVVDERGNATLALELREQAYFVANANDLELIAINTSQQMAPTHALLGHNEQALRWLEIAEAEAKRASRVKVQPHMLAAIRARTYMHLGRYDEAHREADAALADLRADDTSVRYTRLMVISTLAAVLMLKGVAPQERRPVTQERLDLSLKLYGPEHPDVAVAYEDMATILNETGENSKAIEMLERARAIHIEATGPNNPNLVEIDNKLASNQQALGDLDDAEASYRRALETLSILRIPNSSTQINLESNLGTLLQERGRIREALRHQERALTLSEETFGSDGIKTAMVRLNLADVLSNFEGTSRGIAMLEAAGAVFEQGLPPRHPAIALTALSLSLAYIRAGRLDDAETALSKARSVSGDDPMSAGHLATVSATLLEAQGATEQAIERSLECVELLSEKPGYIERLKCLHRASRLLLKDGRRDAAYGLLQPELDAMRASKADPRVLAHLLETLARSEHDPAAARELASEALRHTDGTSGGNVAALRARLEDRLRRDPS